jgi:hypothetical protein
MRSNAKLAALVLKAVFFHSNSVFEGLDFMLPGE